MERYFNTAGSCNPKKHYMVDITGRLAQIKRMVDRGDYFAINRGRQYGKTTTLQALNGYLAEDYVVLSLDFQRLGTAEFADDYVYSKALAYYILRVVRNPRKPVIGLSEALMQKMEAAIKTEEPFSLVKLFGYLNDMCNTAEKPVVLIIDEVDSASNNQVFLDFLAQLRMDYLNRDTVGAFQSFILAGVYDVKNIRRKIRPDEEHKINSPWNIAVSFKVRMSFTAADIAGMLREYEEDHQTGMDIETIAALLEDYTSGYPFLVSRLCQIMDEDLPETDGFADRKEIWTRRGVLEAVKQLLSEKNTLFESLSGKLLAYPDMRKRVYHILFDGERYIYNALDDTTDLAFQFGFFRKSADNSIRISNRIFETLLYDYFLTAGDAQQEPLFREGAVQKPLYIKDGRLDMELVLRKFVEHFDQIYGDDPESFDEAEGRRRFLLYLRPIINGTGHYYIEAQTRNARRMDVVIDYAGEQFVVELKIWRGNAYNERGEEQLAAYLDDFHLQKGYMLSYNFNQKKQQGIRKIALGERTLIEAVV